MYIEASESQTILEQLESKGVEVETGCRDGFCGMCATRVLNGTIEAGSNAIGFAPDNHVLICCSRASTSIELEIAS